MKRLGVTSEALRGSSRSPWGGDVGWGVYRRPGAPGAAEADAASRMEMGSPTTSGSMDSSADEVLMNNERAEERTEEDDEDDATVVAEEFNDDIDPFLDEEDHTHLALPAGQGVEDELLEKRRKENGCDVARWWTSLDFLPSHTCI